MRIYRDRNCNLLTSLCIETDGGRIRVWGCVNLTFQRRGMKNEDGVASQHTLFALNHQLLILLDASRIFSFHFLYFKANPPFIGFAFAPFYFPFFFNPHRSIRIYFYLNKIFNKKYLTINRKASYILKLC